MDSLGLVESRRIASGALLADVMVKAAAVELIRASTICSGRFLIIVTGDRAAVGASVRAAEGSGSALSGSFVISNVSPVVVAALKKENRSFPGEALGIIECRTVSAGIAAADAVVKKAPVTLHRLVTGNGINGKSYFVISGDVASVEEGAGALENGKSYQVLDIAVLPSPDAAVVQALTNRMR